MITWFPSERRHAAQTASAVLVDQPGWGILESRLVAKIGCPHLWSGLPVSDRTPRQEIVARPPHLLLFYWWGRFIGHRDDTDHV